MEGHSLAGPLHSDCAAPKAKLQVVEALQTDNAVAGWS